MSAAEFVIPLTLAVMTCSLTGLIALWAAVSRVHWLLRVAVVEAFLALWLIIPAYEILLVLFVQSLVVVLSLASLRLLRRDVANPGEQTLSDPAASKRTRLQFSLRSMLLAFVAMAFLFQAVIGVVRNTADMEYSIWTSPVYWEGLFPSLVFSRWFLPTVQDMLASPWVTLVLSGIGAGLGALVAAWMTLRRGFSRALMIAGLIAVFAACWVWDLAVPWLGVGVALLMSVAVWFTLRQRTLRLRLGVVLLVLLAGVATLDALIPAFRLRLGAVLLVLLAGVATPIPVPWFAQVLLYPILLCVPLAGWLALLRWAGWPKAFALADDDAAGARGCATRRPGVKRCVQAAAVLVSLLVILPLGVVGYRLATPTPKFQIDLPEPNGFNDLVQAGVLLESVPRCNDTETATTEQLREFVAKCSGAYEAARRGLSRKCRVPIKYSLRDDTMNFENSWDLAQAFVAEGELAKREGRTQDAIASYLDVAHLGHAGACGGLGIDFSTGFAVECTAVYELHEIRNSLTPAQCRDTIDQLQKIANDWESIEEFRVRDSIWCEHVYGWQGRLASMTSSTLIDWRWMEPLNTTRRRLLICELALRAYHAEHGEFPETLRDLAPEYLSVIPDDPFSGRPLIYRRTSTGYSIYSVGPNGKDDGGKRRDGGTGPDDMLLGGE